MFTRNRFNRCNRWWLGHSLSSVNSTHVRTGELLCVGRKKGEEQGEWKAGRGEEHVS